MVNKNNNSNSNSNNLNSTSNNSNNLNNNNLNNLNNNNFSSLNNINKNNSNNSNNLNNSNNSNNSNNLNNSNINLNVKNNLPTEEQLKKARNIVAKGPPPFAMFSFKDIIGGATVMYVPWVIVLLIMFTIIII